jgi:NTP pyrophosphatase (non-canonical NTP hydrolase)
MTFDTLETKVIEWAKARKIIPNALPHTQLLKAVSELGELADAEIKGDVSGMIDGIGDVLVCLINYSASRGLSLTQCLAAAYDEIKDRKGTLLPNGTFVKEQQK